MDAKITKKRLGLLLSYDWIKIVGICVAAVLVWSLLFTTLATRPSNGQSFEMYLYPGVRLSSAVSEEKLHAKDENGALSYDILDFSYNSLADDTKDTIMTAHFAAGQGDVLLAAESEPTLDDDKEISNYNGLDDFLSRYYGYAAWLDPTGAKGEVEDSEGEKHVLDNYFADCAAYLDRFYNGDWENGAADEEAMRANFDARMQKDKRYKNEEQREAGREKEVERIENLRNAYAKVMEWLAVDEGGEPVDPDSPIRVQSREVLLDLDGDGKRETAFETQYAIDLSNIDDLTDFAAYTGEDGTGTADGLHMVILNTGSSGEEDLRYEPITLLEYLVKEYAPEKY